MKLHRIELSGWQCFVEPTCVGPFGEGLNVVHAPNGTGKSTLFSALRHAIFDGHRRSGQDVESLRPWGKSLSPTVAVTFSRGGATYRIEKRFLDAAASTLQRDEAGQLVRHAEREAADEFLRKLFLAEPPGRGAASKPQHWGLAGVLWVPQGDLKLADVHGSLASHIRASLGTQLVESEAAGVIERAIADRYHAIFTRTGKLITGDKASPAVTLRARLEQLEAERDRLAPLVDAFEEASRRVEDLRSQRTQARHAEQEQAGRLGKLREAARQFERLEADCRALDAKAEQARDAHERLNVQINAIRDARKELAATEAERATLAERVATLQAERDAARRRLDDAAAAVAAARANREAIDRATRDAEAAATYARASADVAALTAQLQTLRTLGATRDAEQKRLEAILAPTPATMRKLRRADEERRTARAALDASLIAIEFTPTAAARVDVRVAERPGEITLPADRTTSVRGSPEVIVDVPGFGRIRASGPAGSAEQLRQRLEAAEAAFATLLAPFATAAATAAESVADAIDLDALQRGADEAAEVQATIDRLDAQREILIGAKSLAAIESSLANATRERDAAIAAHPEWATTLPEPSELRATAETLRRSHDQQAADADRVRDAAIEARQRIETEATRTQATLEASHRRAADLNATLARLTADGADDAVRERRLADAALAWHAAQATCAQARRDLDAIGVNPIAELQRAERSIDALRAEADRSSEAEKKAEGRLEELARAGAYSALSQVLEAIAQTRDELAAAEANASAIKLLHETVQAEQKRLTQAVAGPVQAIATDLLRRIAGPRIGEVRLGDRFAPGGVAPTAMPDGVELLALSGGEQEQVHLAVRLALAEVLSKDEPQMVVLDDVLVATDAGRLGRVLDVLAEVGQRLQVVVLTCHPERYRALDRATFIDLEACRENVGK